MIENLTHDIIEDDSEKDESDDDSSSSTLKARRLAHTVIASNSEESKPAPQEKETPSFSEELAALSETADPEELSEDEALFVERKVVLAHEEAEQAGPQPEEGSIEEEVAEARAAFREKIIHEDMDAEQALAETLAEHQIISTEIQDADQQDEQPEFSEFSEEPIHINAPETTDEESVGEEDLGTPVPVTSAGGGATPPPAPPSRGAGGAGGGHAGGGTPPAGGGMPPFGGGAGGGGRRPAPVVSVGAVMPRTPGIEIADEYYVPHPATSALIGGIIGYFIGRRRGRIRTEKKLLPIQKKLEKQVKALEFDISQKEDKISKAVREKATAERALATTQSTEQVTIQRAEAPKKNEERIIRMPVSEARPQQQKETRTPAPEAHQLHGKKSAPESIGQVLIKAESLPLLQAAVEATDVVANREAKVKQVEKNIETQESKKSIAKAVEKRTQTMSHSELLDVSDKIIVNGSSLRQIYETRLVGEKGLRRLVTEHLRGGDVKKALRREITEREIDFERDPIMRDHAAQDAVQGGGSSTQLQEFLKKADAAPFDNREEVAFLKARADYESREQAKQKSRRRLLDTAMATSIVILAALLAILFLKN